MSKFDEMQMVRNEIENYCNVIQKSFGFDECDMAIVLEMVLSTAKQKALTRNAYNNANKQLKNEDKEDTANGDTN